jgi:hypothetical protein
MRRLEIFALLACISSLGTGHLYSQSGPSGAGVWPPKSSGPAPGEIQILPVQGKVWVLIGAGGNITVQAGDDGVLLVDTGTASMTARY